MAASEPATTHSVIKSNAEMDADSALSDNDINSAVLKGSQISDAQSFVNKKGSQISVTPVLVDFRKVIQSNSTTQVVPGVS